MISVDMTTNVCSQNALIKRCMHGACLPFSFLMFISPSIQNDTNAMRQNTQINKPRAGGSQNVKSFKLASLGRLSALNCITKMIG